MQITYLIEDLCLEHIENSQNSMIRKPTTQEKQVKDFNRHFAKEDAHEESASLVILEMHIKTTLRCSQVFCFLGFFFLTFQDRSYKYVKVFS